jgi:hypothetical protein
MGLSAVSLRHSANSAESGTDIWWLIAAIEKQPFLDGHWITGIENTLDVMTHAGV